MLSRDLAEHNHRDEHDAHADGDAPQPQREGWTDSVLAGSVARIHRVELLARGCGENQTCDAVAFGSDHMLLDNPFAMRELEHFAGLRRSVERDDRHGGLIIADDDYAKRTHH